MFSNKTLCLFQGHPQNIACMIRRRFQAKLNSKNTLHFFISQYFHASSKRATQTRSNSFRTNFPLSKQKPSLIPSKFSFTNSFRSFRKSSVLGNGSLGENFTSSQSS